MIHPAVDFGDGDHIVVALRQMLDGSGATIASNPIFADYRDHVAPPTTAEQDRVPHMEAIFTELAAHHVPRKGLYLAWDFTVASTQSLTGTMIHIRDDAFAKLGSGVPSFTITSVTDYTTAQNASTARLVEGTFAVPNYLSGTGGPGTTFILGSRRPAGAEPDHADAPGQLRVHGPARRRVGGRSHLEHHLPGARHALRPRPARECGRGHRLGDRGHGQRARLRRVRDQLAGPVRERHRGRRGHPRRRVRVPEPARPRAAGDARLPLPRAPDGQSWRLRHQRRVPGRRRHADHRPARPRLLRQQPGWHPGRRPHRRRPGLHAGRARRAGDGLRGAAQPQRRLRAVPVDPEHQLPGQARPADRVRGDADAVGPLRDGRLRRARHQRSAAGHAGAPGAAGRGLRRPPGGEHRDRERGPDDRRRGAPARAGSQDGRPTSCRSGASAR